LTTFSHKYAQLADDKDSFQIFSKIFQSSSISSIFQIGFICIFHLFIKSVSNVIGNELKLLSSENHFFLSEYFHILKLVISQSIFKSQVTSININVHNL